MKVVYKSATVIFLKPTFFWGDNLYIFSNLGHVILLAVNHCSTFVEIICYASFIKCYQNSRQVVYWWCPCITSVSIKH